ncbi:MAG: GTP 3',8-cyclase MoaA [Anaerolineae bacterium]|nr:GTP 3',8-cyclase MoaA [Candidatus Roseilinea sp.]MDW8451119.1 GTP 3',8-cyclase MoaA [Anaerolineae bacterium]
MLSLTEVATPAPGASRPAEPTTTKTFDAFGRHIHYLRVSLTDRCNLRCVYCMPEQVVFRPTEELLTDHELFTVLEVMDALGFDKYRLTGGEPTVRPGLVEIVRRIASLPNAREVAMTTNGLKLARLARPLKDAGLNRVNISIDSLDPVKFKRITRWGDVRDVLAGIEAAERVGLTPIKLNAVVIRGFNEDDVVPLARLTLEREWQFRFIEVMPFADVAEFQQASIVPTHEMMARIEAELGLLIEENGGRLDGEAKVYRLPGARGTVGFISPVTAPFCASCNRVRLTADGTLRLCLLKDGELDLRTPLRRGANKDDLLDLIRAAIWRKPWGHDLAHGVIPMNRIMSEIGG